MRYAMMFLTLTLFTACGQEEIDDRSRYCGEGTTLQDGLCRTEAAEEEEVVPTPEDCGPFTVRDEQGNEHEVPSYLDFTLNPDSPAGVIGNGLQTVISINATAHCGDIFLDRILFQTTTDGDDIGWMDEAQHAVSAILYTQDGTPVFHGYGEGHEHEPESSVTGLYWNHLFRNPILIRHDETFTFSLGVTFGDPVIPPGTFDFRLYPRYSWFGLDNPDAYPLVMQNESVQGHILSYASDS